MHHDFKLEDNEFLPLRDVVFQTLRHAILTGELAPGERLMEIHLANQLGVSRTPVREAIHMLELEGLAVIIPRRGAEVASINQEGMQDVLEVRRALDILCAELACERISEENLEALGKACTDFEEATKGRDIMNIASCDVAFHDIILEATNNARLISLVNNLSEQMYRYRFEYIKDSGIYDRLINEHRAIYDAIASRDKEAATKAAGIHIDNQEAAIMNQIALENR